MSKKILSFDNIVSRSIVILPEDTDGQPIGGERIARPIGDILGDPEAAETVIANLNLGMSPREALRFLDSPCDRDEKIPESLMGLDGISVGPFLRAFIARYEEDNAKYRVKVGGKVCDFVFIPDASQQSDCPDKGRGHLSVDVLHEFFESDQEVRDCQPSRTEFYHWDIEVCEFDVIKRYDLLEEYKGDPSHFPNNPFPDLAEAAFPASALDPNDPRSIWCRCLDHKLFAGGKDENGNDNIKIEKVYRQVCNHSGGGTDEDFHLIDPNGPGNEVFYGTTEESCVDIMFAGYPPLVGLPKQREYCLGRCKHPPIVNTGM